MNIGIVTESYLPHVNGVVNLIQSMKKGLEYRGHTVHIFAPRARGYVDRDKNVHRFPMAASFSFIEKLLGLELDWRIPLPLLRRFVPILATLDIIHAHHMALLGVFTAIYAKRHGIPFLFTNHTNYREFEPLLPLRNVNTYFFHGCFSLISRVCTRIISPGEKMKQQLRDYGVSGEIEVIPNGVETSKFVAPAAVNTRRIRAKWGIEPGDRVLVYVGRLSMEKNLAFLIESLSDLIRERPGVKALMVGSGQKKAELTELVSSKGLTDRIMFTGYIPYDQIHEYYSISDVFVTASLSEVFPLTVIEALTSSVPVVAIDAVGTGDIITSGYNGLLTDLDPGALRQAVQTLLDDEDLRRRMGRNAAESVKKLSVDACIAKHLDLYEHLSGLRAAKDRKRARPALRFLSLKLLLKSK